MLVFAISDAVATSLIGVSGVVFAAVCALIGVLVNRSAKQDSGLGVLVERLEHAFREIDGLKLRESHCLDALEWAHGRIVLLEQHTGVPSSPRPRVLRARPLRPPNA